MVSEITVIVKDPEKTLRTKYLIYDLYTVDEHDPIIKDCIDKTLKDFKDEPESVIVKITMEVR